MSRPDSFVTFYMDDQVYALPLEAVVRVARAVEITVLPQTPPFLLGIIDVQGQVVPVLDLRRALGLPQRDIQVDDRILLVNTGRRTLALVVDRIDQVGGALAEAPIVDAGQIAPPLTSIRGVYIQEGRLVLIHNLDSLLTLSEEATLDKLLKPGGERS